MLAAFSSFIVCSNKRAQKFHLPFVANFATGLISFLTSHCDILNVKPYRMVLKVGDRADSDCLLRLTPFDFYQVQALVNAPSKDQEVALAD